ncbi:MAG: hypothetical protein PHR16_11850 [Methylovulum sp.]|nr:hypothetical protein [Methylovulum sp.]
MNTALLPESITELVELIGYTKTQALVDKLGGARFRFTGPFQATVAGIVGEEAYAVLVARYGGEAVELARCSQLLRARKVSEAVAELERGATTNTLAIAHGVTGRTIRNWKKAAGAIDGNQLDLFK